MDNLVEYVKPELLILVPVLYIVGAMIKDSYLIENKYIPIGVGIVGVLLSLMYTVGLNGLSLATVFTAITQGVLVAGMAVYVNQLLKQNKKG